MKKLLLLFLVSAFMFQLMAHDKKSLVERFTNCSCAPCASINNSWYNSTTSGLLNSGAITHVVYNVDWPSSTDPMHILNKEDNNNRRVYYGVNSVPWIEVNGATVSTSGQTPLVNAVNTGNAQFSPFLLEITAEIFTNKVIGVNVKIKRDSSDVTVFDVTTLHVAITENMVDRSCIPCCNNGELHFYNVARKMLPGGQGTELTIPDPGASVEYDFFYIPTEEFMMQVNFDSLKVVAFVQNDLTGEVYQSEDAPAEYSYRLNSAFSVEENLGVVPFTASFYDYSTGTQSTNITSWEWDFDNDGTIDSYDQNPEWTFTTEDTYTVTLTVSDGQNTHTRVVENLITTITTGSDILVVNGIDYSNATYIPEMQAFYNSSACFGSHDVDIWDLFGDQGFDYLNNPQVQKTHLFNRSIPTDVLMKYNKIIWIGNNFSGDIAFYDPNQVLEYVRAGGNFLLSTRLASRFLNVSLRDYCGIAAMSGDLTLSADVIALDPNLVNMPVTSMSLINLPRLTAESEAIPIFDDNVSTDWIAGFRINKQDDGVFIFIAGRPYRFGANASYSNYDYMIEHFMTSSFPTGIDGKDNQFNPDTYSLQQNYPNPFNPVTTIRYNLAAPGKVTLKIYDVLGKELYVLVNEIKAAGNHEAYFNASKLSSGIYFYSLTVNDFTDIKKMVLLK